MKKAKNNREPSKPTPKAKDEKMAGYGKKGIAALRARLGSEEAVTKHFRKLARDSWKNRSSAPRAKR